MTTQLTDREGSLGAHPNRAASVLVVLRDRVVRFDVALVDHRRIKLTLDDHLSRRKSCLQITTRETHLIGNVGLFITLLGSPS